MTTYENCQYMSYVTVKNDVLKPATDNATALNSNGLNLGAKLNRPQANLPRALDTPKAVINMTAVSGFVFPLCIATSTMYRYGMKTPNVDIKELNANMRNDGEHIKVQSNIVASVLFTEIGQHTHGINSSA